MCRRCWGYGPRYFVYSTSENNVTVKILEDGEKALFLNESRSLLHRLCTYQYPLMMALDTTHLKDTCYYCLSQQHNFANLPSTQKNTDEERSNGAWRTCPDCKTVLFCDAHCQKRANDEFHKLECPVFQAVQPQIIPSHIRAVLRVLLLRRESRWRSEVWTKLRKLPAHVDKFRKAGGKRWEELCMSAQCAMEYSGTHETFETVISLFCSLRIRAIPMENDVCNPIGFGLHPLFATIRHSCCPNSIPRNGKLGVWSASDPWLQALQPISDDEELTISYVDPDTPWPLRREILKEEYFIDCECAKCIMDMESKETPSPAKLLKMTTTFDKVSALIASAAQDSSLSGPIQKLRYAAHMLLDRCWPLTEQPFPLVIQQLTHVYMDDLQVNLALAYAALLHFEVESNDVYDVKTLHPVRIARTFQLIKLMEAVIEGKYWEAQRLLLVPRKLNLVYMTMYLTRNLESDVGKVPSTHISTELSQRSRYLSVRHGTLAPGELDDIEKQEAAADGLQRLGQDVLENLKVWRGEITT